VKRELLIKYSSCAVSAKEYNDAKASMPEEELKQTYFFAGNGINKIEYISDGELQTIILDKILGWVQFFGTLTIMGIIAAIILILT
jgi:hypothetical protein